MGFKYSVRLYDIKKVSYSTKVTNKKLYSSTVLLPKTNLPLRLENAQLVERDKTINNVNI